MDGFKVVTYDDDALGTVTGRKGRYVLVQSGHLHKTRVAIRDAARPGGPEEHGAGRQIHQDYVRRGGR